MEANLDRLIVMLLGGMSPGKRNVGSGKRGMQVKRSPGRLDCFLVSPRPVEEEPEVAGDGRC